MSKKVNPRDAGLAALMLLTVALAAVAVHHKPHDAFATLAPPRPAPTSAPERLKVAAFLGDSYTAGAAAAPGHGYVDLVAAAEGWKALNYGMGSTGYASHGDKQHDGTNYTQRVAKIVAAKPDLVIVWGGRNDDGISSGTVRSAIRTVILGLRAGLPKATILVCGPNWSNGTPPADMTVFDSYTRQAARDAHATFLETLRPNIWTGHPEYFSDKVDIHPNDAGHAYIAGLIEGALKTLS